MSTGEPSDTPDTSERILERMRAAEAEMQQAQAERDREFVERVGDAETVPMALIREYGLDPRQAAYIVRRARARQAKGDSRS